MNVNKLAEKIINETNRKDYQHVVYEVVDYLYLNNYLGDRQQIKNMIDEMIGKLDKTRQSPRLNDKARAGVNHTLVYLNQIRSKL